MHENVLPHNIKCTAEESESFLWCKLLVLPASVSVNHVLCSLHNSVCHYSQLDVNNYNFFALLFLCYSNLFDIFFVMKVFKP